MKAHEIAKKLGLKKSFSGYECYVQNEIGNKRLTENLCGETPLIYGDKELFVFSDKSCINRQFDEYFINDNVDQLDSEYLDRVGYYNYFKINHN